MQPLITTVLLQLHRVMLDDVNIEPEQLQPVGMSTVYKISCLPCARSALLQSCMRKN